MVKRKSNAYDSQLQPGGEIPSTGEAAFSHSRPRGLPIPVLIAAPHGGREYPPALREQMREYETSALRLEDRHVDTLAGAVARRTNASLLVAHAPRAMLDLNRALDDVDWSMIEGRREKAPPHSRIDRRARSGLGLVPRRLAGTGEIWKRRLPRTELEARIAGIHRPYHEALEDALAELNDRWGAVLLIDLHSMPPLTPQGPNDRPAEFVIGDRFGSSCDNLLVGRALRYFARSGHRVSHNRPYAGGYVLDRHGARARGVHAFQLEVSRAAYLDKRLDQPGLRFDDIAILLAGLVRELAGEVAEMGRGHAAPLAAE